MLRILLHSERTVFLDVRAFFTPEDEGGELEGLPCRTAHAEAGWGELEVPSEEDAVPEAGFGFR